LVSKALGRAELVAIVVNAIGVADGRPALAGWADLRLDDVPDAVVDLCRSMTGLPGASQPRKKLGGGPLVRGRERTRTIAVPGVPLG
jgi:hypothetical protein